MCASMELFVGSRETWCHAPAGRMEFELSLKAWVGFVQMEMRGKGIQKREISEQGEEVSCCFGEPRSRLVWIVQFIWGVVDGSATVVTVNKWICSQEGRPAGIIGEGWGTPAEPSLLPHMVLLFDHLLQMHSRWNSPTYPPPSILFHSIDTY